MKIFHSVNPVVSDSRVWRIVNRHDWSIVCICFMLVSGE